MLNYCFYKPARYAFVMLYPFSCFFLSEVSESLSVQCIGQSAPAVSVRHLSPGVHLMERAKDAKRHKEKGEQQHAFQGLLFGNCAKRGNPDRKCAHVVVGSPGPWVTRGV